MKRKLEVKLDSELIKLLNARRSDSDNHVLGHILVRYFYLMEQEEKSVRKTFTKTEWNDILAAVSGLERIDPQHVDFEGKILDSETISAQNKERIIEKFQKLSPLQRAALYDICLTSK